MAPAYHRIYVYPMKRAGPHPSVYPIVQSLNAEAMDAEAPAGSVATQQPVSMGNAPQTVSQIAMARTVVRTVATAHAEHVPRVPHASTDNVLRTAVRTVSARYAVKMDVEGSAAIVMQTQSASPVCAKSLRPG